MVSFNIIKGGNTVLDKYRELPKTIETLKEQIVTSDKLFYSQNMATHTAYTEFGIFTRAFPIEKKVIEHDMALKVLKKRLERNQFRLVHFTNFIAKLSYIERESLKNDNATDELNELALDEIEQIEMAICFREGLPVMEVVERVTLSDDFDTNLDILSEVFAV